MAEQPRENRDQAADKRQGTSKGKGKGDGKKGAQQQGGGNPEERRSEQQNQQDPQNTERRGKQNEVSTEEEYEGFDRGERTRQQDRPNR